MLTNQDYKNAFKVLMKHEGGYSDNASDSGGKTNFGLTEKFLDSIGYLKTVQDLTVDDAYTIYYDYWWRPMKVALLDSAIVATKVFDMGVNMGQMQAVKLFQRAINNVLCEVGFKDGVTGLAVDGVVGSKTINAANSIENVDAIIEQLIDLSLDFYNLLAERRPKDKVFLTGWKKRAMWPHEDK